MVKCICFLAHDMDEELERQITQLDTPENEVHLVTNVLEDDFCPPIILSFLEKNGFGPEDELHFYTDMENLCEIVKKIYSRIFKKVTYIKGNNTKNFFMDEVYEIIMQYPFEKIAKEYCVYFKIDDSYFIWEPILGDPLIVTEDKILYEQPGTDICYMYPYFETELVQIGNIPLNLAEYVGYSNLFIIQFFRQLHEKLNDLPFKIRMFSIALENTCIKQQELPFYQLLCYSFLIYVTEQGRYVDCYNKVVLENKEKLSYYQKYFLWRQQNRYYLHIKNLSTRENYAQLLYDDIYSGYKKECMEYLEPIKKENRNRDKIILLTIQFLDDTHAPTRTTLERCMTLQKGMQKEVQVINTIEQLTTLGEIPLYMSQSGAIVKEYQDMQEYTYRDITFRFKQCKGEMPNFEETKEVLQLIRAEKPYMILTLGIGSIVSDLASNIIPVINMPLAFSTIVKRDNQFTSLGRKLSEKEWEQLLKDGYNRESIIEGTFTFDIKEQKNHYTRDTFFLPHDKFLLLVVGIRLQFEVDDEFIHHLSYLYDKGIHLVFAGIFDNYEELCKRHDGFAEHSTFIGYQKDILAINEIIDLYINPRRLGGGFSIAEAFTKAKPGITLNQGDVAATAGKDFCVESYEEMRELIIRYIEDNTFYQEMSQKAVARVKELMNSKEALQNILEEAEKRSIFF